MTHLQKRSGGGDKDSEKYFISCKDPKDTHSWLQGIDTLKLTETQAIIQSLISDGIVRKNTKVVIKIGTSQTIRKEYAIGRVLRGLPSYMRFICLMQCRDNVTRYKNTRQNVICSQEVDDPLNNVLVMNFIPYGSFRNYPWDTKDNLLFTSCLKQIIISLYLAFVQHGFLHTDIHLDNVLIKKTKKSSIYYNEDFQVQTYGLAICIMDFENAFMPVDTALTHAFWEDIAHVFHDIRYVMKLRFEKQHQLEVLIDRKKDTHDAIDIRPLLKLIGDVSNIQKYKIPVLKYNPCEF
jgi:hypothetical protein